MTDVEEQERQRVIYWMRKRCGEAELCWAPTEEDPGSVELRVFYDPDSKDHVIFDFVRRGDLPWSFRLSRKDAKWLSYALEEHNWRE